jgi:hypothetical protein
MYTSLKIIASDKAEGRHLNILLCPDCELISALSKHPDFFNLFISLIRLRNNRNTVHSPLPGCSAEDGENNIFCVPSLQKHPSDQGTARTNRSSEKNQPPRIVSIFHALAPCPSTSFFSPFLRTQFLAVFYPEFHNNTAPTTTLRPYVETTDSLEPHIIGVDTRIEELMCHRNQWRH